MIFNGEIHYNWQFSIAMLNYQRVLSGAMQWSQFKLLLEMLKAWWHAHIERRCTLWLCQNRYGKWPFMVDIPIRHGDFPKLCEITSGYGWLIAERCGEDPEGNAAARGHVLSQSSRRMRRIWGVTSPLCQDECQGSTRQSELQFGNRCCSEGWHVRNKNNGRRKSWNKVVPCQFPESIYQLVGNDHEWSIQYLWNIP